MSTRDQTEHPRSVNSGPSTSPAALADPAPQSLPATSASRWPVRLLLVDDHPVVLMGLSCSLAEYQTMDVVGFAADGDEAVRQAEELSPDVVLMDIDMTPMDGLTASSALRRENPAVKVLFLTLYDHPDCFPRALRAGCRGYVLKTAPIEELVRAIETVHRGDTAFSHQVTQQALNRAVCGPGPAAQLADLSNRECQVLVGVAEGLTTKQIASRLELEPATVETHRVNMSRKLDIHDTATFTRFAVQSGLVSLPAKIEPDP